MFWENLYYFHFDIVRSRNRKKRKEKGRKEGRKEKEEKGRKEKGREGKEGRKEGRKGGREGRKEGREGRKGGKKGRRKEGKTDRHRERDCYGSFLSFFLTILSNAKLCLFHYSTLSQTSPGFNASAVQAL